MHADQAQCSCMIAAKQKQMEEQDVVEHNLEATWSDENSATFSGHHESPLKIDPEFLSPTEPNPLHAIIEFLWNK